MHAIGGKGVFVRELETALLEGTADIAVHSLKDMPIAFPPDLTLAGMLPRGPVGDVLILKKERGDLPQCDLQPYHLAALPSLTIATGSLRRASLLQHAAPQCTIVPLRGNVDSRLKKLDQENWDGIVLAEAGVERLSLLRGRPFRRFDPRWFVPSAAQGTVAIQCRRTSPLVPWFGAIGCATTALRANLERQVLARLGGDCTLPVGIHVVLLPGDQCEGYAVVLDGKGGMAHSVVRASTTDLVDLLIADLLKKGVNSILSNLSLPRLQQN